MENGKRESNQTPKTITGKRTTGIREEGKSRERANSTTLIELWAGREENRKRLRQEEEEKLEDIFKRSNKLIRSPVKTEKEGSGKEMEEERERKKEKDEVEREEKEITNRLIYEEIKGMREAMERDRKEVREEIRKLEEKINNVEKAWRNREEDTCDKVEKLEKKIKEMECKVEVIEKEKEESRKNKMERKGKMGDSNTTTEAEDNRERMETKKELMEIKRRLQKKEKRDRRNNIVIKGLENKEKSIEKMAREFLEKEFGIKEGVGKIDTVGKGKRELAVVELKDWETKQKIMREKSKLGERKIYIDHDLTKEEREVQRILIERAREERIKGKKVKIGYRKLVIDGTQFIWNEEKQIIVAKNE